MNLLVRALLVCIAILFPLQVWAASSVFTWTEQTGSGVRNWTQLDSSYDGTKLVAGVYGGYIYTSDDSGVTWTARTDSGMRSWVSVTSSSDGMKLAAVDQGPGYIYTSSDRGDTWTEHTGPGSRQWQDIESSADGATLVAVAWGAGVYVSTDSGATWDEKEVLGTEDWDAVAISADGTKIFAAPSFGTLRVSTDSGATWQEDTELGNQYWYGMSVSGNGSVVVAGGAGSLSRISNDSGTTWRIMDALGYGYWSDPGISNDGTIIVLVDDGRAVDGELGRVLTSNDSGTTWATNSALSTITWSGATVSGDGTRAAISAWGSDDDIFTADTVRAVSGSGGADYARSLPRAPRVLISDVRRESAAVSISVAERNGITAAGFTLRSRDGEVANEQFTTSGTGSYNRYFSDLLCGTSYEVRAYAQNALGKTRSDSYEFSTDSCRTYAPSRMSHETVSTSSAPVFTQDLFRTITHDEVRLLQQYLNQHGFIVAQEGPGSVGMEATYFGPMTQRALTRMQAAAGIAPAHGYFGPLTRAYLNSNR